MGTVICKGDNRIMKIVILMGMSCVGKDRIRKTLCDPYWDYINIVSHTSRPARINEIEGSDYFFVSKEEFNNLINNNEMIEYRNYETNWCGKGDTWFYGVKKFEPSLNSNYIIVMDLEGAESIIRYFGEENCIPIYLTANDNIREVRAIERGSFDKQEWNRRMLADYKDFSFEKISAFMRRHKVWEIENNIYGDKAIKEIANVINFIAEGRLH